MLIRIPGTWVSVDTESVDLENLKGMVTDAFRHYTEGTRHEYVHHDKLMYIDQLRKVLHPQDECQIVHELIVDQTEWKLNEYGDLPDADDYNCVEFMEECCRKGDKPLYDHYEKHGPGEDRIFKVIEVMIKAIMDFEWSDKE